MLTVFYGNDNIKVRQLAFDLFDDLTKKNRTGLVVDFDSYSPGIFSDITSGQSLFGEEYVYLIDTPRSTNDFFSEFLEYLASMKQSEKNFVVIEGSMTTTEAKEVSKYSDSISRVDKEDKAKFNNFSLTDALADKNKKSLWLLLNEANKNSVPYEELVGLLWWQLKTLRLAFKTDTATEAGMKDYPYKKAKRALSKWSERELEAKSNDLIKLLHQSRLGGLEIDLALEKWVLEL